MFGKIMRFLMLEFRRSRKRPGPEPSCPRFFSGAGFGGLLTLGAALFFFWPEAMVAEPATSGAAAFHYGQALSAAGEGDCERLRREAMSAARLGYEIDPGLLAEWGFRCGVRLDDSVSYSLALARIALSRKGGLGAAATIDGRVFIFCLRTSKCRLIWNTHLSELTALDFSEDGTMLAAGGEKRALILNLTTGRQVWTREFDDFISSLKFTPGGKTLVVGLNRYLSRSDQGPTLQGQVRAIGLTGPLDVSMKNVPGNPAELAITSDGKRIAALCWPEKYAMSTIAHLMIWDLESGELELRREIRTSSLFPARFSGDARVLAYSKFKPQILDRHQHELNREGRPRQFHDAAAYGWISDPESFQAAAISVFSGSEVPLVGGKTVIALDYAGRTAALLRPSGEVVCEEAGAGRVYQAGFTSAPSATNTPLGDFGGEGDILVLGRTNGDLARFGWLPPEISPVKP